MQTNDQFTNLRRIATTTNRFSNVALYKADDINVYRHIKPSQSSVSETSTHGKVRLDGKLTEFDLFRAIQQHSGNSMSVSSSKDGTNHSISVNPLKHCRDNNATPAGKVRKTKSKTSPSKKTESKVPYMSAPKKILPKPSIGKSDSSCEVKKFAPEINGLLTDLSTALKTSLYSNQIMASTTTFSPSKLTSVHLSAKTTAKNFNEAKYNLLFGHKNRYDNFDNNKSSKDSDINKELHTSIKKSSPEETRFTRSTSISTREYLNELKSSYKQTLQQTDMPYQSLSKFFSDTKESSKYLANSEKSTHQSIQKKIAHAHNKFDENFRLSGNSFGRESFESFSDFKNLNFRTHPSYNNPLPMKNESFKKIPDLLRDSDNPVYAERKTVITPTPSVKVESIKGFSELYENAVKNLLSIEVFPQNQNLNKEKNKSRIKSQSRYFSDKEIDAFMKSFSESEKTSSLKTKSFQSNATKQSTQNISTAFNIERKIDPKLYDSHLPVSMKANEKPGNPSPTHVTSAIKTTSNQPSSQLIGYTLTELLDTNEYISLQKETKENFHESQDNEKNIFQTDLPWLYPPILYKNLPPSLPAQPTYLQNVFLPYQEHVPKLSTKETITEMKLQENETPKNQEIIKTSTPVPPESPPSLCQSEDDDEEVKTINAVSRKSSASNSRRNTPVTPIEKKTKALKYRPYRLRDRLKSSKKVKEMMGELAKEPPKPKYIVDEINEFSSEKEIFLGELGLRRILEIIPPARGTEKKL